MYITIQHNNKSVYMNTDKIVLMEYDGINTTIWFSEKMFITMNGKAGYDKVEGLLKDE